MREIMPVDPSKTLINHDDEPAQPPPRLEVGLAGWLRQNLFGSSIDVVITPADIFVDFSLCN